MVKGILTGGWLHVALSLHMWAKKTAMKYYWYWFFTYFVVQVCVAALLPLDWHVGRYYENVIHVIPVLLVSNGTEKGVDDLKS